MDFKSLDLGVLKRLTSPKAAGDLNIFLERLPHMAGQTVLIAAAIVWSAAAASGLYATVQAQSLTKLRHELKETKALQPPVPSIKDVPVGQKEIEAFAKNLGQIYSGLSVKQQGASIYITSTSTSSFGQFREAVGHVQNGGSGWRVTVEKLCVGRECERDQLGALLKINKVSVEKTEVSVEKTDEK